MILKLKTSTWAETESETQTHWWGQISDPEDQVKEISQKAE